MIKKIIFLMAIVIFLMWGGVVMIPLSQSDNGDQRPMSPTKTPKAEEIETRIVEKINDLVFSSLVPTKKPGEESVKESDFATSPPLPFEAETKK